MNEISFLLFRINNNNNNLLLRIVLEEMETVDSLKMRMSLRLLIPSVNFHILHNKKELR